MKVRLHMLVLLVGCAPSEGVRKPTNDTDSQSSPPGAPNVLLLLADDLGQDVIPAYGRHPDPPAMPVVDGLAAEGVRFRTAWAYPVCSPTRAAILTGRYGRRHGIGNTINAATSTKMLRPSEVILPRMLALSPHGYRSIATGKWHLSGWASPQGARHPLEMGFEHHDGHMGNLNEGVMQNTGLMERGYYRYERASDGEVAWSDRYVTTETVDDTVRRLGELSEPWFAYVAFNAPHAPLHVPPIHLLPSSEVDPDSRAETYRAMVQAMDAEIGRLLDSLDPDVRERTVVIFAGDNGTSEQGTVQPWRDNHAKNTPFEGGVNVPLIITGPGIEGGGREEDAPVHVLDLYATIGELAGVSMDEVTREDGTPVPLDSVSLLPHLVASDAEHTREYVYTENLYPNGAPPYTTEWNILRDQRWKLISGFTQHDQFFDLNDPHPGDGNEHLDLLADHISDALTEEQQAAYARLRAELDARLSAMPYESPEP